MVILSRSAAFGLLLRPEIQRPHQGIIVTASALRCTIGRLQRLHAVHIRRYFNALGSIGVS
jgi:hypothetical protein